MELEDLNGWLRSRMNKDEAAFAQPQTVINIDLGDLLARILDSKDRVRTRESYAPYPS